MRLVLVAASVTALICSAAEAVPADDAVSGSAPASVQGGAAAKPPAEVRTIEPRTAEAILGSAVVDSNGKEIGRLVDVLVDGDGHPEAAVIDFGGFLGVGARKVAVHWSALRFGPADGKHEVRLEMSRDEIKAAPAYVSPDKPARVVTPLNAAQTAPR